MFFVLFSLLLLSFVALVSAQSPYDGLKITDFVIENNGKVYREEPGASIAYEIHGAPGAVGSVSAAVYNGNPQPNAVIASGVSLSHFVVVTFNMDADEFSSARIIISYTDAEVQNMQAPYTVYKYVASTNSFVALPSTDYSGSNLIIVEVTSIDDPLFAVGGATVIGGYSTTAWLIIIGNIVAIIVIVVLGVMWYRRSGSSSKTRF